jgi:outer membrane lipoprotein-sorting protein
MSQPPVDPDQLLEDILGRLRQQQVPPMPESLIEPAMRPARPEQTSRIPKDLRSWIMQRRVPISATVLAAAAVVLFLALGPFGRGRLLAFSDVQKAIDVTKTMTYDCLVFNGDDDPFVIKFTYLGGDRVRSEISGRWVEIINRKQGAMMSISHVERKAVITSMYPSLESSKRLADTFSRFRTLPEEASRRIGEREYEGRKVIDFAVKLDDRNDTRDYTVTVDSKTKLPIRMECASQKSAASGRSPRELFTNFVFDAPVAESLFAMTPPAGYKVERRLLPKNPPPAVDDRSLVISPETGIGQARFGMSQEEVIRALGQPDWSSTSESTMEAQTETGLYSKPQIYVTTTLDYSSRGFSLNLSSSFRIAGTIYPGYGLLMIRVFDQASDGPTVRDFQGKTKEGIRLGATRDEVLKIYGKPSESSDKSFTGLAYLKLGWLFDFRHGKLAAITLNSPLPADQLKSGKSQKEKPAPATRK